MTKDNFNEMMTARRILFGWLRQQPHHFTGDQLAVLDVFARSDGLGPLYADLADATGIPALTIYDMCLNLIELAYEILDARGQADDVIFPGGLDASVASGHLTGGV